MFIQDNSIAQRINLCDHSILKWHEVTKTLAIVFNVREITGKKCCKQAEYGLFLIFLLALLFWSTSFLCVPRVTD